MGQALTTDGNQGIRVDLTKTQLWKSLDLNKVHIRCKVMRANGANERRETKGNQ
jgi:hypothetical protein